jgi:hydroxyacylglutathione hydrolase
VIVAEDEEGVRESQTRLARVGIQNVVGYLDGGVLAGHNAGFPLASTELISVQELKQRLDDKSVDRIIDVRRPKEWNDGHISGAKHRPLNHLADKLQSLNRNDRIAVTCAGRFRSSIAASILERHGFSRVSDVVGGMSAWINSNLPTTREQTTH